MAMTKLRTANTPNTGRSDDWFTPAHIIEALRPALGPFDLDPATSDARPFDTARVHYTVAQDGLSQPWEGHVWLNPPYSDPKPWMKRLADHGNGIALIFARTETEWFRSQVWARADALLFLDKRVAFVRAGGDNRNPGGGPGGASPSVLVGYGAWAKGRLGRSGLAGWMTTEWHRTESPGLFGAPYPRCEHRRTETWGPIRNDLPGLQEDRMSKPMCNNEFGEPGCSGLPYRCRCAKYADHKGVCRCTCGATIGLADKATPSSGQVQK